jgi:uncharacterized membrane protein
VARRLALNEHHRRFFLLALVLIAFAWRAVGLDRQSLWRDEVDAIYFAVRTLGETLSMFTQAAQNGPLYFLGLRPWFGLMGTSEFVLRLPSAVAGTASVPLLWQLTRRLLPGREAAAISTATAAAVFMAFNPYQVWYGQEGKMYATITLLALLATWFWLRGIEGGGWQAWLAYLITVSIAMYTHLLMVMIIPLHFVWFLIAWPMSRQHWRGYGLALAGLTLPYLPMVWWHWWLLTAQEKLSGFNFTPLDAMLQGLLLDHVRGFTPTLELLWLAPVYFLLGAGVLLGTGEIGALRQPDGPALSPWRRYGLVFSWLVLPVLFIFLISLRQPVFTARYVIWIGPAAMLFLALGLRVVERASGRLAPVATAIFLIYILAIWSYANWQQKTTTIKYDLRSAVAYIQAHRDPAELLILQIPHQEWSYRYYSSDFGPNPFTGSDARLGRWVGGPYTNYGEPDAQAQAAVAAQMEAWTANEPSLWVMLSEAEMWDSRRLMDTWLAEHATVVDEAGFPGVQVRRYVIQGVE